VGDGVTSRPEWPVAFFDDDYLKIYLPTLTEERTRLETDFLESALAPQAGAAVLDLACGVGRHALDMARRGYRVTGVDFNARYLERAAADAKARGLAVTWTHADMREIDADAEFEGAYSFFTSFGYFSDVENERVIERVARALKPGGRFVLDMVNRDWLLTHPHQRTWTQRDDGALLMEETDLDLVRSRVIARQILIAQEGGARVTKEYELRAYTAAELGALLERHGLEVRDVWGGADRSPYSIESRRLVLLAEKVR
jgi:SAM-dependent methyltransferase